MENLTVVSTIFLTFHCRQSIRCVNSFGKRKISPLFEEFFGLRLQAIYPLFQFFSLMRNPTFVLIFFWPYIVRNLSVVSNLLSNGKSNHCFNTFLALHCRQSFRRFNSFLKKKISPLFQQLFVLRLHAIYLLFQFFCETEYLAVVSTRFWLCTVASQSVVSILLSHGKSNRCFNTFLSLHCR